MQDQLLSYVAMPLAVNEVTDVRGVQTDQVGRLVELMNQAGVSPDRFIEVFRFVPVALVLGDGRSSDFVPWVETEVQRGVVGDALVSAMEQRLTTYGSVVDVTAPRQTQRVERVVYERDYVPPQVRTYVVQRLYEPMALIDLPLAVAHVVDLGVPNDRVSRFVQQLNLGSVSPVQSVEILRYSPPALMVADLNGQPDLVQYVYDQRLAGATGYDLVRVIDRQLVYYDVSPQIDLVGPAQSLTYAPLVVRNYVEPLDVRYVPPVVQSRFAGIRVMAPAVAASPQVERLFGERNGPKVVMAPGQIKKELRQRELRSMPVPVAQVNVPRGQVEKHELKALRGMQKHRDRAASVYTQPRPEKHRGHGAERRMVMPPTAPQPMFAPRGHGNGHGHDHGGGSVMMPAPQMQPAPGFSQPGHGNGKGKQKKGKG